MTHKNQPPVSTVCPQCGEIRPHVESRDSETGKRLLICLRCDNLHDQAEPSPGGHM